MGVRGGGKAGERTTIRTSDRVWSCSQPLSTVQVPDTLYLTAACNIAAWGWLLWECVCVAVQGETKQSWRRN